MLLLLSIGAFQTASAWAQQAKSPDFADGLSGGPDWWQVANLTAGDTLNVRSGPGTRNPVVGQLANGDRVRNRGCRMNGRTRWCKVELSGDSSFGGWVAGRFLKEAAPPSSNTASGRIPCAMSGSQPMTSCAFRVSRGRGGTASVWVALPAGGERYLDFREGKLVGSNPGLSFRQRRTGDLNRIRIGGQERYEIPDALIYGG
jgi:uncharacterized protein YraI